MVGVSGKVAVVTGGAGGIGSAIATHLAEAGASVALWDLDEDATVSAAATIEAGGGAIGLRVDVTDPASIQAGVDAVEQRLGPVDILVNNAGIDVIGPFLDSDEGSWDRVIAVNLTGTILCCHRVARSMVDRGGGAIVNIGSDAGRVGSSGEAVYSATKGGVIAFTKALARELARSGVRVNCVCPGPTDTPLLDQLADTNQALYDALARAIPMRRIATPSDIAPAVLFLAGDGAGYITGQTLSVSGGLTMS
ncbi:MAG: SDR family NAD(P)-dependent oxidoreductase [Acidimicrobiia bacterium]